MNDTANSVNTFTHKLCKSNSVHYVDLSAEFIKQGNVVKALYDNNDVSGVHVNIAGEVKLCEMMSSFCRMPNFSLEMPTTPSIDRKRTRSETTVTPSSADGKTKQSKTGSSYDNI